MSVWFRNPDVIFPTIYNYHAETGEYLGEGYSDPSPLEEGVFADPAHSTRITPPTFKDKQKPIWNGKNWLVVADHRGETWFDKDANEVVIKELGNPADKSLFSKKPYIPEPAPTMEELLAYAADKRYQIETAGITLKGFKVATDDRSKTLITGLRIKAESDPAYTTEWKGEDGKFVTIDAKTVIGISNAVLEHVAQCFTQESIIVEQIKRGELATEKQIDEAYGVLA